MKTKKLVVHTDIIADHLLQSEQEPSLLRMAMRRYFCYTTVVNAMELFSCTGSDRQRRAVEHTLGAMKILGVNSRTAKNFGTLIRQYPDQPLGDLLVAGICLESRLPLLTRLQERFSGIRNLRLVRPASIG